MSKAGEVAINLLVGVLTFIVLLILARIFKAVKSLVTRKKTVDLTDDSMIVVPQ